MNKLALIATLVVTAACCFAQDKCCDEKQMTEAKANTVKAKAQDECCKSTAAKHVAKGEAGCCNAKGEVAKFKVYVVGAGYKLFGCEDSAKKGREEIVAKGTLAGPVQKVVGKKTVIS